MSISKLVGNREVKKVLGVDASTNSLAFCLMERKGTSWTPVYWGKMDIAGTDIAERCGDINKKLYGVLKQMSPDAVVIEGPVFVNNYNVLIKLSKIIGAATGVAVAVGCDTYEIDPVSWMNHIGNPTRDTKEFKRALMEKHPGQSRAWYKNESRRLRKQRTMDWVEQTFGISIDDDDVGDAFGLAHYGIEEFI